MDGPLSVEVRRAGNLAMRAGFDAVDITVGANLAAPRLLCHSNDGRQCTGLGADFAPKAFAETALDASAPPMLFSSFRLKLRQLCTNGRQTGFGGIEVATTLGIARVSSRRTLPGIASA